MRRDQDGKPKTPCSDGKHAWAYWFRKANGTWYERWRCNACGALGEEREVRDGRAGEERTA